MKVCLSYKHIQALIELLEQERACFDTSKPMNKDMEEQFKMVEKLLHRFQTILPLAKEQKEKFDLEFRNRKNKK